MTAAGSGDAWRISGEDRAKHDSQFFSLKPINGFVTGEQARGFFMQSGLPTPVLGQIWSLADMNNDGKMDKKEFSIAMHLIKKRLQGYEIPKSLPPSMKADPSPVMGSFGVMASQPPVMGMAPMGVGMAPGMPMMANGMAPMVAPPGYGAQAGVPGGFPGQVRPQGAPAASGANLAMPHQSKLKYTQMFNSNDHHKRGTLTGVEARSILVQTGVPQQMLAQIWNLSDIDKDGKLDCDEFCIAMHLIDLVKMGHVLPVKLPAELMPNKARSGSFGPTPIPVSSGVAPVQPKDSFGDLLGTMGMPPPVQPAPVTNGDAAKIDEQVTFEDKRKENFDKGQAELEKRRQMLQDQMKREQEARLQKERDEQEKRDKIRREQEMKKQQAMERQLEKQRELERQKEEQRQKMMEQRESARRELERQRQMEWERQRKEQLMAEKTREYEQLTTLKAQTSNLKCELESLQGKKTETSLKISQVKNGLNDFTAHIEAMRSTRDLKNKDIDRLQGEIQNLNQQLLKVQSEKSSLDLKVQTSIQSNPMSETHRTMMHSVELKKTSVQRLKKDIESIEKETETKLADIDTLNTQNSDLQKSIGKLQADISAATGQKKESAKNSLEQSQKDKDKHEKLKKDLEAQRLREETQKKEVESSKDSDSKWFDFGGDVKTTTATTNDNWASVFDTQAVSQASSVAWESAFSSQPAEMKKSESSNFKLTGPTKKYKALYQFDARNLDELSLLPGDIVMVFDDQTGAEPEWIGGEVNGKRGWFPEAYVEKMLEESSQSLFGSTDTSTLGLSSSEDSSFMAVQGKVPAVSPTPGQGKTAPEGLQAQALYPWKAKKDNHLTFNKGDIINVKEQQDMWWSGEFGGKTGWFPKSYVKMVSGPSVSTPPITFSSSPMGTLEKVSSALGSARESPAPVDKTLPDNTYVAVYTYQSTEPGDLTFNQGDIITVSETEGDWWTGTFGSVTGIFPANYVKKQEPQSVTEGQDPFPEIDIQTQVPTADPFSAFANFPESGVSIASSSFSGDPLNSEGQNVDVSFNGAVDAFASFSDVPNINSPSTLVNQASNDQSSQVIVHEPSNTEQPVDAIGQVMTRSNIAVNEPSISGMTESLNVESKEISVTVTNSPSDIANNDMESIGTSVFNANADKAPIDRVSGALPLSAVSPIDTGITLGTVENTPVDPLGDPFSDKSEPFVTGMPNSNDIVVNSNVGSVADAFAPTGSSENSQDVKPNETSPFATVNNKESSPFPNVENKEASPFPNVGINEASPFRNVGINEASPFPNVGINEDSPFQNVNATETSPFNSDPFGGDPFGNNNPLSSDPFTSSDDPFKDSGIGDMSVTHSEGGNFSSDPFASFSLGPSAAPSSQEFTNAFPDTSPTWGSVSSPVSIESLEKDSALASSSDLETMFGSWGMSNNNTLSIQTNQSLNNLPELGEAENKGDPFIPPRRKRKSQSGDKKPGPPLPAKTYLLNAPPSNKESNQSTETTEADKTNESTDNIDKELSSGSEIDTDDTKSAAGTLKKPEIATVIAAYTATGNEQLSLSPGQLIQVRKKSPSGWWEGELQARGQKRKIGWFPANYVKLLGSSARNTPDNTLVGGSSPAAAMFNNASPAPVSQSSTPQPTSQPATQTNYVDHVIAIYPYSAQNPDELTFQKDSVINVTKKDDPDWWQGECNGEHGMFPSNYVTSTSPESTSWSSDPQVIAMTSAEEGKRQMYIHELINTEESYMKDMSIVLEAFYKPLSESGALTEENLKNIFVNWKELIVCNTKLQKALRVRKKMSGGEGQVINSIGDILCENIPHLTPYIRFCSCQLNAAALLQRISENNSLFNEVHKKCVQNTKTKGMPMSSFLLKPMQRITKYPLIVDKILQYTPEGHPDHNHLVEALEHCQELCSQVNEGVREKENSDRLEWIQQHVHCDGLPEKITFNSVTNCLGPRKILHTGVVYKIKSNKELGAFLFNDFLLLTTSNRPLTNATHSLFDVTGQVQYKMYKTPVFLNEVMIKKLENPEDDSFVVSHIDRVFHLRCNSKSDRDIWLKHLNKASSHYLDTVKKKREKAYSSPKHSRGVGRLLVIIIEGIKLICSKDVRRSPGVGRLLVVIIEGKALQSSDDNGKSDPYCEVSMGAQEHKTKVINNSLNPKWNASMQFTVKDLSMDALCITVFDRDLFSPNDFLGRTEIRIQDILREAGGAGGPRQPLVKHLVLHEVPTGEIVVKLDLHLFDQT